MLQLSTIFKQRNNQKFLHEFFIAPNPKIYNCNSTQNYNRKT